MWTGGTVTKSTMPRTSYVAYRRLHQVLPPSQGVIKLVVVRAPLSHGPGRPAKGAGLDRAAVAARVRLLAGAAPLLEAAPVQRRPVQRRPVPQRQPALAAGQPQRPRSLAPAGGGRLFVERRRRVLRRCSARALGRRERRAPPKHSPPSLDK